MVCMNFSEIWPNAYHHYKLVIRVGYLWVRSSSSDQRGLPINRFKLHQQNCSDPLTCLYLNYNYTQVQTAAFFSFTASMPRICSAPTSLLVPHSSFNISHLYTLIILIPYKHIYNFYQELAHPYFSPLLQSNPPLFSIHLTTKTKCCSMLLQRWSWWIFGVGISKMFFLDFSFFRNKKVFYFRKI